MEISFSFLASFMRILFCPPSHLNARIFKMHKNICYKIMVLFILLNADVVWSANLVKNGDFENGSTGWTEWSSPGAWVGDAVFEHDYASLCDIWVPSPYPYEGNNTHCQKLGDDYVHGGIYQVINVTKGKKYKVTGQWSGGVGGLDIKINASAQGMLAGWLCIEGKADKGKSIARSFLSQDYISRCV